MQYFARGLAKIGAWMVGFILVPWTFVLMGYHMLAHVVGLPCPW